jgi:hypothetical protein
MGREIRRVPPDWEHPKKEDGNYQPLCDRPYTEDIAEWISEHLQWERGEHPDQKTDNRSEYRYYAEWAGEPPSVKYYRPDWKPEEMTWYQVYETVSEGTPVTPPFATKEELVEYLVGNVDFCDQARRKRGTGLFQMPCDPWTRKEAEAFVYGAGWAPSGVVINGEFKTGVQALADMSPNKQQKEK